jgi:uncharacterized membrane protein YgcG
VKMKFVDVLDQALAQGLAGQPRELILESFPQHQAHLKPLLETAAALGRIQPVEMPTQAMQQADRRQFMRSLDQLDNQPVSLGVMERINNWMMAVFPSIALRRLSPTQEKRKMNAIFVNLALMITLLIASAGGTVAAAANSLPDSPLYPLKLAVEQVQVDLLADPEQIAVKHLELAQNRSQEMLQQVQQGSALQQKTSLQLQEHYNLALQYAAQLGEAQMAGILTRAQQMIQNQLQEMEQVRSQLQVQQQDPLGEPLRILQQTQSRVQAGLEDPLELREQARNGFGEAGGNPECPYEDCLTANQYRLRRGYHQQFYKGPRAGYAGPATEDPALFEDLLGDQDCDTCQPVGDENRYGQDPDSEPGYGPGQPGGNPDPDCDDCEPSGDENKYGQQPDQPGDGQPGGNPDCSQQDCEPDGDQHQEGQTPPADQEGGSGGSDPGSAGSGGNDSSGGGDGSGGKGGP